MQMDRQFIDSMTRQFQYYKLLGEKTFAQLHDRELVWQSNPETNSIAVIVKHLWGNMLSRWTDFLHSDGEKDWRDRDAEFQKDLKTRKEMLEKWEEGWKCLFDGLAEARGADLSRLVYIRNEGHTVHEALLRQLAHCAYHIGQIVHIGKNLKGRDWVTLTIPRDGSDEYNRQKFAQDKSRLDDPDHERSQDDAGK